MKKDASPLLPHGGYEGSGAAATSRKSEMLLTNVAGPAFPMNWPRTTRAS